MQNEIKNGNLNDKQIAFKEHQIKRAMQDKKDLIKTFYPELKNVKKYKEMVK